MPDQYHIMDKAQARKSIKSLLYEATNLTPSSLMEFFEIDLSSVAQAWLKMAKTFTFNL